MKIDKTGKETLEIMRQVPWYNNWLFSFLEKYLAEKILEVGSGIGNFTKLLSEKSQVYATDINRSYIKDLRKTFKSRNVKVGFADIEKGEYFFKKVRFDVIVCLNVLEHIRDDDSALKNMFKLLKPNGTLVLLVPAFSQAFGKLDEDLGHFRRYIINKVEDKLKSAGFKEVKSRYLNFVGIFGWFVNARVLKRNIIPKFQLRLFDKLARPLLLLEKYINLPIGLSVLAIAKKR